METIGRSDVSISHLRERAFLVPCTQTVRLFRVLLKKKVVYQYRKSIIGTRRTYCDWQGCAVYSAIFHPVVLGLLARGVLLLLALCLLLLLLASCVRSRESSSSAVPTAYGDSATLLLEFMSILSR